MSRCIIPVPRTSGIAIPIPQPPFSLPASPDLPTIPKPGIPGLDVPAPKLSIPVPQPPFSLPKPPDLALQPKKPSIPGVNLSVSRLRLAIPVPQAPFSLPTPPQLAGIPQRPVCPLD